MNNRLNSLTKYIEELKKTPLLDPEEELKLWQKAAEGNPEAFTILAKAYQPLVFSGARKFKVIPEVLEELISEGTVALIESAERFDYKAGIAFSVFASQHIRGVMINFLKKETNQADLMHLEEPMGGGDGVLSDFLEDHSSSPFAEAFRSFIADKMQSAVARLPLREKQVITALYFDDMTAKETAERYSVSLGHVYRSEKKGIQRLRGSLSKFAREMRQQPKYKR